MAKKRGSIIKAIILAVLILIITGSIAFSLFGERAIVSAAEKAAADALGVPVSIGNINLRLTTGSGTISGLDISNPEGFNNPFLMQMDSGDVKVNIRSLLSDTVVVDKVHLDNVHITFEQKGLSSNVQVINNNVSKSKPPSDSDKDVVVSDFQITNSKLSIKLLPLPGRADTITVPLPDIHLQDVGKEDSMSFEEIVELVFVTVSEAIVKAGSDIIPGDLLDSLQGSIKGAFDALGQAGQSLLETGGGIFEGGAEAGEAIREGATRTLEGIGNIFGRQREETADKEED